jgi:hypothetical protein
MKIKTSVSIDRRLLTRIKALAKSQDRSVSYLLEKFIEGRVRELPEEKKVIAIDQPKKKISYSTKKRSSG